MIAKFYSTYSTYQSDPDLAPKLLHSQSDNGQLIASYQLTVVDGFCRRPFVLPVSAEQASIYQTSETTIPNSKLSYLMTTTSMALVGSELCRQARARTQVLGMIS